MKRRRGLLVALLACSAAAMAAGFFATKAASSPAPAPAASDGIHKIKHIVVIMQENRSFDHYFGTYPGADGIAMKNGVPVACLPNPGGACLRPYHSTTDVDRGGPHNAAAAQHDINGGKMDGFVQTAQRSGHRRCVNAADPTCATPGTDTVSYHDGRELANYWKYAHDFVLQDHLFEPNASWSLPQHLFMVSEWSASCSQIGDPMSCVNALDHPDNPPDFPHRKHYQAPGRPDYAWTDLTYLLHQRHVSWGYYVMSGLEPDCADNLDDCASVRQSSRTLGIWNVLPYFDTVKKDGELGNVRDLREFYTAAKNGTLPSVVWICPALRYSEHPPGRVSLGQSYVTGLVNTIMQSPEWDSTAIFISWDDWGGFYDHVVPPRVDENGYGLRVPGLVVSPYARKGFIDHQVLSHDAYVKFIEDDFLSGARIDPKTDGRPDKRPSVREIEPQLGDLRADFDFSQTPRAPETLPNGTIWNGIIAQ